MKTEPVEIRITVSLHKDRYRVGVLTVAVPPTMPVPQTPGPVVTCPCLGISDNAQAIAHHNPTRNTLLPFGDTPTGVYAATVIPPGDVDGYGVNRRLFLTPVSGDGVKAESTPNNRSGLLIHGGKLNPAYTWWDGLRPTYGCVRVPDDGMARVLDVVDKNSGAKITVEVVEV